LLRRGRKVVEANVVSDFALEIQIFSERLEEGEENHI
jgi:hypothetical protein